MLETVKAVKYLGVTIQGDLCWDDHINNIVSKANKTLGFLRRNLKISSRSVKEQAYKAFVRPILEYASKFQPLPGITLYDSTPSPCARRVRMTPLEKGIPFTKVEVNLLKGEQMTDEYKRICPNKKVPAISFMGVPGIENCSLYESNVITEFLDSDIFPTPKLYPRSHWERAEVKMWQDWELGLVDDFFPLMYGNTMPFILQLMHSSKDAFLSSLPAEISQAKKEY
ncbi:hypothetical protein ACOMHN_050270 [Nucella lapillus]